MGQVDQVQSLDPVPSLVEAPQTHSDPVPAVVKQNPLGNGKDRLRPHVVHKLAKLPSVDVEIHAVVRARRLRETEGERDVVAQGHGEIEGGGEEADAWLADAGQWTARCPLAGGWGGQVVALALGVESALVERPAHAVPVGFPTQVAADPPGNGGCGPGGESVGDDAAGEFVHVGADLEVFVKTHVVDDDREVVGFAGRQRGQGDVLACDVRFRAGRTGDELIVEVGAGGCCIPTPRFQVKGFLRPGRDEVSASDNGADVEAVVACIQAGRGGELAGSIIARRMICCDEA